MVPRLRTPARSARIFERMVLQASKVVAKTTGISQYAEWGSVSKRNDHNSAGRIIQGLPGAAGATGGRFKKRRRVAFPKDVITIRRKSIHHRQGMVLSTGRIALEHIEPQLALRAHADHFDRLPPIAAIVAQHLRL